MNIGEIELNNNIWECKARIYCDCGDASHLKGSYLFVKERAQEFIGEHIGKGHCLTDPKECLQVRKKRGKK